MKPILVRGFSLIELLITITVLGIATGMVVALTSGTQHSAEDSTIRAELAQIRKACQQFAADMGAPPRFIAELLQSPKLTPPSQVDADNAPSAWPWRPTGSPQGRLRIYDPSTQRGWNGPYLRAELTSSSSVSTQESRIKPASVGAGVETINSSVTLTISILVSDYTCHPQQQQNGSLKASHYQLDHSCSQEKEIVVRFIHDPFNAPSDANPEIRLGLGMQPNE